MAPMPEFTLDQIVSACGGKLVDPRIAAGKTIRNVAAIGEARPDSITWVADAKHSKHLETTEAAAVIGSEEVVRGNPKGIIVKDAELAVAQVLDLFDVPMEPPGPGLHPTALIHATAKISEGVRVGAFSIVQANASIGAGTVIHEGVSIGRDVHIGTNCTLFDRCMLYDRTILGNNVRLHAGVVLGADGFGYIFRDGVHRKLAHLGNVIIEDDVEIGPNSVVDRGKLGPTRVGRGSKIDALVMIGHNAQIGPLCILAGQVGLSGSVRLGVGVALGGHSGVIQGITIGDQVQIGALSVATSNIAAGETVIGFPARNSREQFRDWARVRKLQKLYDQVAELSKRVKELEAATDHRKHG